MLALLFPLPAELERGKLEAIAQCNPMVAKTLTQNGFVRHIPLQRELGFIFGVPDWGTVPSLMCGTPTVGHAVRVPGMMTRNKKASCTINDVVAKPKKNNLKMISQATPTGDINLDEKAWKKTQDEIDRGIALLVTNWMIWLTCLVTT